MRGPYFIGAVGLLAVFVLSYRLAPIVRRDRAAVAREAPLSAPA